MQICLDIYFLNYIFLCFCIESSACPGDYSDKYLSNRLFLYLNICFNGNIQPTEILQFRGPLQSVRRTFFSCRPVVILHREPTRPQDPSWRTSETFGSNSSSRIFPIARWERAVFLSDNLRFVRQKRSLCEAGAAPKSRPIFKLYNGY